MEIKERLVKLMQSEGLNSSAFADSIGVQRSSISHILSGRNKPSLDLLEKILASYPRYNAEWLVMGTGQVYKLPVQSSLFDSSKNDEEIVSITRQTAGEKALKVHENAINEPMSSNNTADSRDLNDEELAPYKTAVMKPKPGKIMERVVLFYTDGTFDTYLPNEAPDKA